MANTLQTFFADPATVLGADVIGMTAVELYFKSKPSATNNQSGIANPGVSVSMCAVDSQNNYTILGTTRNTFDQIYDSSTAVAATVFSFRSPVMIQTGKMYGFLVSTEDDGYQLWANKAGDKVTGTNDPSSGPSTNKLGKLFVFTGSNVSNEQTNTQLKFVVSNLKYTDTTAEIDLVNKHYEFLSINTPVNAFVGGEKVFANTALAAGTIGIVNASATVTGSGTSFNTLTSGQYIVVTTGAFNQIAQVLNVANSTSMTVEPPLKYTNASAVYRLGVVGVAIKSDYVANKVTLVDSTANSTLKFTAGQLLTGEQSQATAVVASVDNISIDRFTAQIDVKTSVSGTLASTYSMAYSNGSVFIVANTYVGLMNGEQQTNDTTNEFVLSRSNEVAQSYLYTNNKSIVTKVTLTSSNPYAAPVINDRNTDIIVYKNQVSNNYTRAYANSTLYDSEVGFNGVALSKHITRKMTFDAGRRAEDLVVYASCYRPVGTDIRFYARLYNSADSEAFDDKYWTPLEYKMNKDVRSSVGSRTYVEYQLGLSAFPASASTIAGAYTTSSNSNIVTAVGATPSSLVSAGQRIKLYNETFPSNYIVATVSSANTTALVIDSNVTFSGVLGAGQKIDILEFGQVAFNNGSNFNICRYYNGNGAVFDTFDNVQIKAVFLADTTNVIPEIDQIEVIGVSA